MPTVDDKPTLEFIDQAKAYLETTWGPTRQPWMGNDEFYAGNYIVWPDAKRERNAHPERADYKPARASTIIDRAIDTHFVFAPRIHREPRKDTQAEHDSVTRVENGLAAIIADSALQETLIPFRMLWAYLIHLHYAVAEVAFDWASHPLEPERGADESEDDFKGDVAAYEAAKANWNPIRIRAPHPSSVLLEPDRKQPRFAIKTAQVLVQDLSAQTRRKVESGIPGVKRANVRLYNPKDKNPFETVDIDHYWSAGWHAVKLVGGEILWMEQNAFGFVPFSHAFAGPGIQSTNSKTFLPAEFARGMLDSVKDGLRLYAQGMNASMSAFAGRAYPLLMSSEVPPDELAAHIAKGGIVPGNPTTTGYVPTPEVAQWMFEVVNQWSVDIEQGTFTDALSGFRQAGVSTVGQQAILSNAALRQFQAPLLQLQHLATFCGRGALQMVDTLAKTSRFAQIGVNGKILSAEDINHDYNVTLTFDNIDPMLQLQKRELGLREFELGLESEEGYMTLSGVEDIEGKRDQLDFQRLMRDPVMVEVRAERLAQKYGVQADWAERNKRVQAMGQRQQGTLAPPNPSEGEPQSKTTMNPLRENIGGGAQNPGRLA